MIWLPAINISLLSFCGLSESELVLWNYGCKIFYTHNCLGVCRLRMDILSMYVSVEAETVSLWVRIGILSEFKVLWSSRVLCSMTSEFVINQAELPLLPYISVSCGDSGILYERDSSSSSSSTWIGCHDSGMILNEIKLGDSSKVTSQEMAIYCLVISLVCMLFCSERIQAWLDRKRGGTGFLISILVLCSIISCLILLNSTYMAFCCSKYRRECSLKI